MLGWINVSVLSFLLLSQTALASDNLAVAVLSPDKVVEERVFTVLVDVGYVESIDASQFDISFNEDVIMLCGIDSGNIAGEDFPVQVWNRIDEGTYRLVMNFPGYLGVNGEGSLATLHFRAVGSSGESSSITISNGFLSDNEANEIPADWISSAVDIKKSSFDYFIVLYCFVFVLLIVSFLVALDRKVFHLFECVG